MKNFKKINELFTNITKQIYKRHDNNFLIILNNWKLIVGNHLSNKSIPKKLSSADDTIVTHALELLAKGGNPSVIKYMVASCFGFSPACRMPLDLPDLQLRQEIDVFLNSHKPLLAKI